MTRRTPEDVETEPEAIPTGESNRTVPSEDGVPGPTGSGGTGDQEAPPRLAALLNAAIESVPAPGVLAKLAYYLVPIRRSIILANLRRVFGEHATERQIRQLAQANYGHSLRSLLEFLVMPCLPTSRQLRLVEVQNLDSVRQAVARGKGLLLLSGHLGNWEIATTLAMRRVVSSIVRIHVLRRPVAVPWVEKLVLRRFEKGGFGVIARRGSVHKVLETLQRGDAVAFALDQYATRREGVMADFLGSPARTSRSLALMAMRSGAPVLTVHSWRKADGSHGLRFGDPLPKVERLTRDETLLANTQVYNDELSRLILQHPEQWLWMHRRWKAPRGPSQPPRR